jgi:hypothetical protein
MTDCTPQSNSSALPQVCIHHANPSTNGSFEPGKSSLSKNKSKAIATPKTEASSPNQDVVSEHRQDTQVCQSNPALSL